MEPYEPPLNPPLIIPADFITTGTVLPTQSGSLLVSFLRINSRLLLRIELVKPLDSTVLIGTLNRILDNTCRQLQHTQNGFNKNVFEQVFKKGTTENVYNRK